MRDQQQDAAPAERGGSSPRWPRRARRPRPSSPRTRGRRPPARGPARRAPGGDWWSCRSPDRQATAVPTLHASGLSHSFGANTVFADVSFSLPPRERLALIGRNGAGKTTLLRVLAGEAEPDAGSVSYPKGYRLALHDQRPPLARGLTLGGYVGEGLTDVRAAEARLGELEARMAGGDGSDATLAAYDLAQRQLEAAGGYAWRSRLGSILHGLGLRRRAVRPAARVVLGRRADACLARARARLEPRSAAARRADEPPRPALARVARGRARDARLRRAARLARSLVPRARRDGRARARARPGQALQHALQRVPPRARRGAAEPGRGLRAPDARRSRASSASSPSSRRARARVRRSRARRSSTASSASRRRARTGRSPSASRGPRSRRASPSRPRTSSSRSPSARSSSGRRSTSRAGSASR